MINAAALLTIHKQRISALTLVLLLVLGGSYSAWPQEETPYRRNVNLEWEPVQGAAAYAIKLTPLSSEEKSPNIYKTKHPKWDAQLSPGHYSMQMRSFDFRGVPGEWSDATEFWVKLTAPKPVAPKSNAHLPTNEEESAEVQFQWQATPGADHYLLSIWSKDKSYQKEFKVSGVRKSIELDVAKQYFWQLIAITSNGQEGDVMESPTSFALHGRPLEPPKIVSPETKLVRQLSWTPPKFATSVKYALLFKDKAHWRVLKRSLANEPTIDFDSSQPSGTYRLVVMAEAPLRPSSKAEVTFDAQGGFRSPASFNHALMRDSLKRKTEFYAIASYYLTQMQYTGEKNEKRATSAFSVLGGTGRLGLGYQADESVWGYYSVVDLSGFTIDSQNLTFAASELHATWSSNWQGLHQLEASSGIYYKELPEVEGSTRIGLQEINKVSSIGPHVGFTYFHPISFRLGLQLNGRAYYGLGGTSPSGSTLPSFSYQLGIRGSLKLDTGVKGYLGYAFRSDQILYPATPFPKSSTSLASPGDINRVEIQGHYLNLMLEYGF